MHKQHRALTPKRREAWRAAIAKRFEHVTDEEHYALLQEGMLGDQNKDMAEEAELFLTYWFGPFSASRPIPWLGPAMAHFWFGLRKWERQWGRHESRLDSERALRDYIIAADDFDHWIALNEITARLHENRERFPRALADWNADMHRQICDGTFKPPAKERGNRGQPPYAHEDRNMLYDSADSWLEHYGMEKREDRVHAISDYTGDSDDVIRKGLKRWREHKNRRAPWPAVPANR